jgi:Domain of unknown function (DUF4375)
MTEPAGRLPRTADPGTDPFDAWTAILRVAGPDSSPDGPIGSLTPSLQRLHGMLLLDSEVKNGGFSQFFFNGGGAWLDEAIGGFGELGLDEHKGLTIEVADLVAGDIEALRAAQASRSLESYAAWAESADLERYDDRWYELDDIADDLERFVQQHSSEMWES